MSGLPIGRGKVIGITAAAAVVLTTMSSGGAAQAAHPDPSGTRVAPQAATTGTFGASATDPEKIPSACTVKSYAPSKIVLGGAKVTKTFSVKATGCTLGEWAVFVWPFVGDDPKSTAGMAGNVSLRDVDKEGNPFWLELEPKISLSPQSLSNGMAGKWVPGARVLAWGEEDPVDTEEAVVIPGKADLGLTLQRNAVFGTFNASPEPVKKGKKITLKGTLSRINWNHAAKLKYAGFAGKAQVQFKADGTSKYVTVKTVMSTKAGKVSTTVKATKTGRWRLVFPGRADTAPATSGSDAVKVK